MRNLVILGSTGSIGRNALDIVDRHPGRFKIIGLAAGKNAGLLAEQIRKYNPPFAAIEDGAGLSFLKNSPAIAKTHLYGGDEIYRLCLLPDVDIVLNAIVGFAGLRATAAALGAGKRVALANKESMVAAGPILRLIAKENGGEIIPVDSEHSAIFQCLKAGVQGEVARLILTSSGGPFLGRDDLSDVSPAEALHHPTWKMGPKITIDSATLMNKGLEIIEAAYLFDMPSEKISVVIHPQSIVHSMVEFIDGSIIAQMSKPDMRLPIQYALFYPDRLPLEVGRLNLGQPFTLQFSPPPLKFVSLELAYRAVKEGAAMPATFNSANEVAVAAFLDKQISFMQIYEVVGQTMNEIGQTEATSIDDIYAVNLKASKLASKIVADMAANRHN